MHGRVAGLIASGSVRSAHDVSDGGLAVAIAEMCIAADIGATLSLSDGSFAGSIFAPLATTYILEMPKNHAGECGLPIVGRVEQTSRLTIERSGSTQVDLPVSDLADAWRSPLARGGGQ